MQAMTLYVGMVNRINLTRRRSCSKAKSNMHLLVAVAHERVCQVAPNASPEILCCTSGVHAPLWRLSPLPLFFDHFLFEQK